VIPPRYSSASAFSHGVSVVRLGDKFGVIDTRDKFVVPPIYDSLTDFGRTGFAVAKIGDKAWLIDRTGRKVTKDFADLGYFETTWAGARRGHKWGAIDARGRWIVPPKYECIDICDGPPPVIQTVVMPPDDPSQPDPCDRMMPPS
jgi:hypothetical protein